MTKIKDSDVRNVLENMASEINMDLKYEINPPFKEVIHKRGFFWSSIKKLRLYDKIYTLNGLYVACEAYLGWRKRGNNQKDIRNYLVTQKIDDIIRNKVINGIEFFDSDIIEGPIVDDLEDVNLNTIRINSILVQYVQAYLENANMNLLFVDELREKYQIEILYRNHGINDRTNPIPIDTKLEDVYNVFSKRIDKKEDLEKGIRDVYAAGCNLERAIDEANLRKKA